MCLIIYKLSKAIARTAPVFPLFVHFAITRLLSPPQAICVVSKICWTMSADRAFAKNELQKYTKKLDELRHSSKVYADIDAYRRKHGQFAELPFFNVDLEKYDLLQERVRLWSWIDETLGKSYFNTIKKLMLQQRQNAKSVYILTTKDFHRNKSMFSAGLYGTYENHLFLLNSLNKSRRMLNILTVEYNDEIPFNEKDYKDAKHNHEELPRGNIFTPLGPVEQARETLRTKYNITDKRSYKKFMLENHPDKNRGQEKEKTELTQKVSKLMQDAVFPWA